MITRPDPILLQASHAEVATLATKAGSCGVSFEILTRWPEPLKGGVLSHGERGILPRNRRDEFLLARGED